MAWRTIKSLKPHSFSLISLYINMGKYQRICPANGCPRKKKGQPCGLEQNNEEWAVQIHAPVDAEVANLMSGRPSMVSFVSQRRGPENEKQEMAKSLRKEIRDGDARCEHCQAQVTIETSDVPPSEETTVENAVEDHLKEIGNNANSDRMPGGQPKNDPDKEGGSLDEIL